MTEQQLIDTINALIDADVKAGGVMIPSETSPGARSIGVGKYSRSRP